MRDQPNASVDHTGGCRPAWNKCVKLLPGLWSV